MAYAVIQSPVGEYIVLGRIRVYYAVGNDSIGISYCGKDEFRAIIELCWKSITGQEMPGNVFWNVLEEPDASIAKHLTNDMRIIRRGVKRTIRSDRSAVSRRAFAEEICRRWKKVLMNLMEERSEMFPRMY